MPRLADCSGSAGLCIEGPICYPVRVLTRPEQIAWVAGLFEGEGSATLGLPRSGSGRQRRLQIANTERDIVERAKDILGVGTIQVDDGPARMGYKPELFWSISSWLEIEMVIGQIFPFLGQRRTASVVRLLENPPLRALREVEPGRRRFVVVAGVKDPRTTPRKPSKLEWWAWAAGLFEGEGSAICRPMSRRRVKQWQRRLQVPSSDRDVLDRLREIVRAGHVRPTKARRNDPERRLKPMFVWTCSKWSDIERIAGRFYPFLCARRRIQVDFLLRHPAGPVGGPPRMQCKRGHPLSGPGADVYIYGRERQCRRCKATNYNEIRSGALSLAGATGGTPRARKTHCIRGHPLDGPGSDVYLWSGMRQCRPCANEARKTRRLHGRRRDRRPRPPY